MNSRSITTGRLLAALSVVFLAACSTPPRQPGETFDRVSQEMKAAAVSGAVASNETVLQALMPPLDLGAAPAAGTEHRFDLAVNAAPAAQVFMAIVSGTRFNMLVPPEVSGSITLKLKNVTVREALETIRDLYGYDFTVKGTRIFIQPNTMQTRMFQINYLSSRRQGVSDTRVTSSSPSVTNPGGSGGSGGSSTSSQSQQQSQQQSQSGQQGQGSSPGLASSTSDSSHVQTRSDVDFWRDLTTALNTIVGSGDGRSVIINTHSGIVLIKAMPSDLRAVESYLKATQVIVERQVMLEAKIVEVQLSESYQSGINWSHFGGNNNRYAYGSAAPSGSLTTTGTIVGNANGINGSAGSTVTASPGQSGVTSTAGALAASAAGKGFFGLALQTANFAALLNFLESQGDAQVLSSPRVATINNQKAVLKVGTDDYFVTNITTTSTANAAGGQTSSPTITLQPFFSGVALDVTPQIDDDGNVILHVHPTVSVVQEKSKTVDLGSTLGKFILPLASSSINETDAIVRVQDGYIVAIGGLMSQEQARDSTGLPGTGSSSASALFNQRNSLLRKRELVVLIKPTIIQNEAGWKQDLLDTQARIEQFDPRRSAWGQPQ